MIGLARSATRRPFMLLAIVGVAALIAYALVATPPSQDATSDYEATPSTMPVDTTSTDQKLKADIGGAGYSEEGRSSGSVGGVVAEKAVSDAAAPSTVAGDDSMDLDTNSTSSLGAVPVDAKIIQNGTLTVVVKKGKVVAMFNQAGAITSRFGGYVATSQMQQTSGSTINGGTMTLRIPAAKYTLALNALSELGKVTSRSTSSTDVSQEYVDTASRLRHDEAVEARLLLLLGKAKTINETLTIQTRLDTVQEEIEVEKGRIRYLDKQTAFSTVDLSLSENGKVAPKTTPKKAEWGFTEAWKNSAHRFVSNINRAIIGFGGLAPLLLAGGAIALAFRFRKGRKARVTVVNAMDTNQAGDES